MLDARTLLRAKRQGFEARITHPYASYNAQGQLRCSACGMPIKNGAAMWEGHIGSKPHRVAVRNLKAREEEEKARELKRAGKRKAGEEGQGINMEVDGLENGANAKKRKTSVEPQNNKASPALAPTTKSSALPADFFSDPSLAPVLSPADEDEEDENLQQAQPQETLTDQPKSQIDLEWEQFQASLAARTSTEEEQEDERRLAFENATIVAEPELVTTATEGFPPEITTAGEASGVEEPKKEETEEERQRRKEQEDRELIMDRLIEEERAQEEADERVGLLKARVEALKKAREARAARHKVK